MKIYTVKDTISGSFSTPFTCVNDDDMKRRIGFQNKDNPFAADMQIFACALWDEHLGLIHFFDDNSPLYVCTVKDCVDAFVGGYLSEVIPDEA